MPAEGVHAYVRATEGDSVDIRARMMFGGLEDAATGSANCALVGMLASQQVEAGQLQLTIAQGVEVSSALAPCLPLSLPLPPSLPPSL
eukprot:COSAG03_NODE_23059_length_283_cov_2.211957_1_plen_87_part_01